jgi:hypothetical protein
MPEPSAVAAYIRALLAGSPPNGARQDWGEWRDTIQALHEAHAAAGAGAVRDAWAAIQSAHHPLADLPKENPDDSLLEELATLSPIDYDRRRIESAERLGIRVSTLDRIIAQARGTNDESAGQGYAITFSDDKDTPWPAQVEGAHLPDDIAATYRRHIVLPHGGADTLALWTLHTHAHDVATVSPMLALQSPRMRCGKTTTLQILSGLVARALPCSNITPAAIF